MIRQEVHVIEQPDMGHVISGDCWCEPRVFFDLNNIVVQHCDWIAYPHDLVVARRNEQPGWLTGILNEIG
jgi:hypothetical protein